jgi:hypothetical protein
MCRRVRANVTAILLQCKIIESYFISVRRSDFARQIFSASS